MLFVTHAFLGQKENRFSEGRVILRVFRSWCGSWHVAATEAWNGWNDGFHKGNHPQMTLSQVSEYV